MFGFRWPNKRANQSTRTHRGLRRTLFIWERDKITSRQLTTERWGQTACRCLRLVSWLCTIHPNVRTRLLLGGFTGASALDRQYHQCDRGQDECELHP